MKYKGIRKTRYVEIELFTIKKTRQTRRQFRNNYPKGQYIYNRSRKIYEYIELQDKIFRSSIVYNYDSHTEEKELTPKGNYAEIRAIFWSNNTISEDIQKWLEVTIKNINAKVFYPFIGLEKHGKTILTIGKEINQIVSRTEMKPEDKINYCSKYARFQITGTINDIWDNQKVEEKMKIRGLQITTLGFVRNPKFEKARK